MIYKHRNSPERNALKASNAYLDYGFKINFVIFLKFSELNFLEREYITFIFYFIIFIFHLFLLVRG